MNVDYYREYYRAKREEILEQKRTYRQALRLDAILGLGGRCKNCGHNDPAVLTVIGFPRGDMGYVTHYIAMLKKIETGDTQGLYLLCQNCKSKIGG